MWFSVHGWRLVLCNSTLSKVGTSLAKMLWQPSGKTEWHSLGVEASFNRYVLTKSEWTYLCFWSICWNFSSSFSDWIVPFLAAHSGIKEKGSSYLISDRYRMGKYLCKVGPSFRVVPNWSWLCWLDPYMKLLQSFQSKDKDNTLKIEMLSRSAK